MNNRMKTNKETIKEPRRILSKPLSVREQWALCDEDAYLEGIVSVTPAEFVANDLNGILTLLSERLVGDPYLRDVTCQVEDVTPLHGVVVRVRGCIDECEPPERELDEITTEIRDGILMACKDDTLSELIGEPVDGKTREEKEQQVSEFLDFFSIRHLIRYYKMYAMPKEAEDVQTEPESGKTYLIAGLQYDPESYMTKDGMERLDALRGYYENRYPYHGYYFNDLGARDRHVFLERTIPVADLIRPDEETILRCFLMLNRTGKRMDTAHLSSVEAMLQKLQEEKRKKEKQA